MKNEAMAYWNVLIVNKSKTGGGNFSPFGFLWLYNKSGYTSLRATFCTSLCGASSFFIPVNQIIN